MKISKRLLALLFSIAMIFSFAGCSGSSNTNENESYSTAGTIADSNINSNSSPSDSSSTDAASAQQTDPGTQSETDGAVPVDLSSIPAFSGDAYVVINNNQPHFSAADLTTTAYESYSELDNLGRCGTAIASCGKEIMPAEGEERGSISNIDPSGWKQAKYSGISGGYLWNRCHLIGWQLSAENANRKNLITGTRYMNTSGMLPFENMVADYIKETGNHVAYRVTPIYEGNNLVCSGVQMEAYSIEDQGGSICFNVYCYNVQPGITIHYATGDSSGPSTSNEAAEPAGSSTEASNTDNHSETNEEMVWISKSGSKYHNNPNCSNMKNPTQLTIEDAKQRGYEPCKKCY